MKTKAELEEAKMTESARYHASKKELEQQVHEQVSLWFQLNTDMLSKHKVAPETIAYETDNLKVSIGGVKGICYVVAPLTEPQKKDLNLTQLEVG